MLRLFRLSPGGASMILTCPSCQTRYVVPDSAIGAAGRKVRCARCRHSWFQEPAGAAPAPVFAAPVPPPAPERRPPPPPREPEPERAPAAEPPFRPRRNPARMWTIAAAAAGALMIAATVAILVFGVPDLGRLFGMPVQGGTTLTITGDVERRQLASGNELLEVRGEIVNGTDQVQRVPQIRAELKDGQDRTVYTWAIAPPVAELQPRGRVAFTSANIDVPRGGRRLSLTFGPAS